MPAASAGTRGTLYALSVVRFGDRLAGIRFLDMTVAIPSCHAVWSIQSFEVAKMQLAKIVKPNAFLTTARIAVEEVKSEAATIANDELAPAMAANDSSRFSHVTSLRAEISFWGL